LTAVLALAWSGAIVMAAWKRRPPPRRARVFAPPPSRATTAVVSRSRRLPAVLVRPVRAVCSRRDARRRRAQLGRELPDAVDLLVLAVGAGLTVPLAVAAVARRSDGLLAAELRRVLADVRRGRRLADALDDLPARAGEGTRPLVGALVASERYGAPVLHGLERLAEELRRDARRRAEEAARRVPVKLLFPLVTCTLPAFALLTVAPLIAGTLGSLRL
jgi:tight adherence protein C